MLPKEKIDETYAYALCVYYTFLSLCLLFFKFASLKPYLFAKMK